MAKKISDAKIQYTSWKIDTTQSTDYWNSYIYTLKLFTCTTLYMYVTNYENANLKCMTKKTDHIFSGEKSTANLVTK